MGIVISGEEMVSILLQNGFQKIHQRGSHVKMTKQTILGKEVIIVPNHKELKKKTLYGILKSAKLRIDDLK